MDEHRDNIPSRSISTSLLRTARNGDQAAWDRLVRLFHPFVYRWFRRWSVPESDAPDLVQNVFANVFSAIDRFDRESPGTSFRGWLWRIARNQANDYYRTRRPLQIDDHSLVAIRAVQDSDEVRDEGIELLHRLLELVRGDFQPKTIEVFWRCSIDGRDTEDVAIEFKMKKSAVREAKRRVMNRLRGEFEELLGQTTWQSWPNGSPQLDHCDRHASADARPQS